MTKTILKRFDRRKKEHILVPCSEVVKIHNFRMGNFSSLDSKTHDSKKGSKREFLYTFFMFLYTYRAPFIHLISTVVFYSLILYQKKNMKEIGITDTPVNNKAQC